MQLLLYFNMNIYNIKWFYRYNHLNMLNSITEWYKICRYWVSPILDARWYIEGMLWMCNKIQYSSPKTSLSCLRPDILFTLLQSESTRYAVFYVIWNKSKITIYKIHLYHYLTFILYVGISLLDIHF